MVRQSVCGNSSTNKWQKLTKKKKEFSPTKKKRKIGEEKLIG